MQMLWGPAGNLAVPEGRVSAPWLRVDGESPSPVKCVGEHALPKKRLCFLGKTVVR